jgi:diketogulonate reductase-like aldo/keto reductase
VKTVRLPCGEHVPAYGMGTWRLAESAASRADEIATLRLGLDRGATLIDTAEMYGEGAAEALVGEAIRGRRDEVFLVTKIYPHHADHRGTTRACERSLKRLGTDRIDLYLLHWRGGVRLAETLAEFDALQRQGKIRYYGVSNFDADDMAEVLDVQSGRDIPAARSVQTDQVLYNLMRRGLEWDLLPWLRGQQMPLMAYSPLEEGRLLTHHGLGAFARRHNMTAAQAALAWLFTRDDVIVIPKSAGRGRLLENLACLERALSAEQVTELEQLFPPPDGPGPLEMI